MGNLHQPPSPPPLLPPHFFQKLGRFQNYPKWWPHHFLSHFLLSTKHSPLQFFLPHFPSPQ